MSADWTASTAKTIAIDQRCRFHGDGSRNRTSAPPGIRAFGTCHRSSSRPSRIDPTGAASLHGELGHRLSREDAGDEPADPAAGLLEIGDRAADDPVADQVRVRREDGARRRGDDGLNGFRPEPLSARAVPVERQHDDQRPGGQRAETFPQRRHGQAEQLRQLDAAREGGRLRPQELVQGAIQPRGASDERHVACGREERERELDGLADGEVVGHPREVRGEVHSGDGAFVRDPEDHRDARPGSLLRIRQEADGGGACGHDDAGRLVSELGPEPLAEQPLVEPPRHQLGVEVLGGQVDVARRRERGAKPSGERHVHGPRGFTLVDREHALGRRLLRGCDAREDHRRGQGRP